MKKSLSILFSLLIVSALGQDLEDTYCFGGCCGCIYSYWLKLDSKNTFELYSPSISDNNGEISYGVGTYKIENELLTLNFKTIELYATVEKVNESDSLIVDFTLYEAVNGDTIDMVWIKQESFKEKENLLRGSPLTFKAPFSNTETLTTSIFPYADVSYTFKEPGVYKMTASLILDVDKTYFSGETMVFRTISSGKTFTFRNLDDPNILFTNRNCGCED